VVEDDGTLSGATITTEGVEGVAGNIPVREQCCFANAHRFGRPTKLETVEIKWRFWTSGAATDEKNDSTDDETFECTTPKVLLAYSILSYCFSSKFSI
jgi:hypothetical protein